MGGDFGAEDSISKSSRATLRISTSHMTPTHLMTQRRLLEVRVQPAHILAQHAGGAAHAIATRVDVVGDLRSLTTTNILSPIIALPFRCVDDAAMVAGVVAGRAAAGLVGGGGVGGRHLLAGRGL